MRRPVFVTLLLILFLVVLVGCGGGGGSASASSPVLLSGRSFDISWPQRSRAITGPASALSAAVTFKSASAQGKDITINVDRDTTNSGAYTGTYPLNQTILSTTTQVNVSFYAGSGETGSVVGTASGLVSTLTDNITVATFTLSGTITVVKVLDPGTLTAGNSPVQLGFQALDNKADIIPITPGSATWQLSGTSVATLTSDGKFSSQTAGTSGVTVTIDGITSPVFPVTVASASGGSLSNASISIAWPARSRDVVPALSSALSAVITFRGSNPLGGDGTLTVDRDTTQVGGYTGTYQVGQQVLRTTTQMSTAFYSGADGSGSVVGFASGSVDATGNSLLLGSIRLVGSVQGVTILDPGAQTAGSTAIQLQAKVADSNGAILAVTPGSIFWTLISGTGATLTQDGLFTPTHQGAYMIRATVDGIQSPPFTVTVSPVQLSAYNFTAVPLQAAGYTTESQFLDNSNTVTTTQLGTSSDLHIYTWQVGGALNQIGTGGTSLGASNAGIVLEQRSGVTALPGTLTPNGTFTLLPSGGTDALTPSFAQCISSNGYITASASTAPSDSLYYQTASSNPVAIPGSSGVASSNSGLQAPVINKNGHLVGGHLYWSSPTSQPTTLNAPAGSYSYEANLISDNDLIVGSFQVGSGSTSSDPAIIHLCTWSSPTATPVDLGSLPATFASSLHPTSVNSSGTIVGNYDGINADTEGGFIYSSTLGLRDIRTVIDSSAATGYYNFLININDNGWILGNGRFNFQTLAFVLRPN